MTKRKISLGLGKEIFTVYRDGELIGVGMNRTDAITFVRESRKAYPDNIFSIVSGGVVKPGNKGEKS